MGLLLRPQCALIIFFLNVVQYFLLLKKKILWFMKDEVSASDYTASKLN
jgi:hypothetical protein